MTKIEMYDLDPINTVLDDIFYNENDLFNSYVDYDVLNTETHDGFKRYNIALNFESDSIDLQIEHINGTNILYYDIDLSIVY